MKFRDLLPYCLLERRLREQDGSVEYFRWTGKDRIRYTPKYWLPHALVHRWLLGEKARRQRRIANRPAQSGFDYGDGVSFERIGRGRDDRRAACPDARVLVCLHLEHADLWPAIAKYLESLSPYRWRLVVTYPKGRTSERALAEIKSWRPDVRLLPLGKVGAGLGPFVRAIESEDLGSVDVVFRLRTMPCNRRWMFVHDRLFKKADWFLNLFDGILGAETVHRAIVSIASGDCLLAAAENLIVGDPRHRRTLVRRMCESRGLEFVEDYRFVAGSCYAVSPRVLEPLRALSLSDDDLAGDGRGGFGVAEALERWLCFAASGRMLGLPVAYEAHLEEAAARRAQSALRLLEDPRFDLDEEFAAGVFEFFQIDRYEVAEVRLGDLRRIWFDMRTYPLDACAPYRYLEGDETGYLRYCDENAERYGVRMSRARFDALRSSMSDFDGRHLPLVYGPHNIILDGQHRSCILLKRFGPEFRIRVVRIYGPE